MIDLHIHSTYSDGRDSVEELLKQAQKNKLELISITDHNTLDAYKNELINYDKYFSGKVIIGCEVSSICGKEIVEILAYGIKIDKFYKFLKTYFSDERKIEILKRGLSFLYKKADEKGLKYNKIEFNDLKPTDTLTRLFNSEISKHSENKELYMEDAWGNNTKFARNYIANPDSEWYVDNSQDYPTMEEVIEQIHKAEGLCFVAHPLEYSIKNIYEILDKAVIMGIDGIEVFHVSSGSQGEKDLAQYAKQKGLYISGGSDYHRVDHQLKHSLVGGEKSNQIVEMGVVSNWIDKIVLK